MRKLTLSLMGTFMDSLTTGPKTQEMHRFPLHVSWPSGLVSACSLHRRALSTGVPSHSKEVISGKLSDDSRSALLHLAHRKNPHRTQDSPYSINEVLRTHHQPSLWGKRFVQARDNFRPLCPSSEGEIQPIQMAFLLKLPNDLINSLWRGDKTQRIPRTLSKGILLSNLLSIFF